MTSRASAQNRGAGQGFDRWLKLGYAFGGGLIGGVVLERGAAVGPGLTAMRIDTGVAARQLIAGTNWAEQEERYGQGLPCGAWRLGNCEHGPPGSPGI
jgi:hypothetical protein